MDREGHDGDVGEREMRSEYREQTIFVSSEEARELLAPAPKGCR